MKTFRISLCSLFTSLLFAAASQAASPFNGKDLDDWKTKPRGKNKDLWSVGVAAVHPERANELIVKEGSGEMINTPSKANGKSLDIYSTFTHGDARIELEIMVPKGSNSGIYLHGEYEIQVLDSSGRTKLGMDDMHGGTFTVTTLGMFGVDSFTPILNAGQTGILGVNRIADGVRWEGDRPIKCQTMRLSLTWDHRVLDGEPAARFLGTVRDLLEAPYRLLV